jgi:hypothetical protein
VIVDKSRFRSLSLLAPKDSDGILSFHGPAAPTDFPVLLSLLRVQTAGVLSRQELFASLSFLLVAIVFEAPTLRVSAVTGTRLLSLTQNVRIAKPYPEYTG